MSTLYIVSTPIGNLEDITLRALRVLKEVDLILCEDTRQTRRLTDHYDISTPLQSYNSHSSDQKHEKIIDELREGRNIALVSDAGTPTISDPGVRIVKEVLEAEELDVNVVTIPGPSAVTAALSISGLPSSEFLFLGFLPHKKGRQTLFNEIADIKRTVVFYESPHRILKTLESLEEVLNPERTVVIARELTKIYEEGLRGSATDLKELLLKNPEKQKGEFVVMVSSA